MPEGHTVHRSANEFNRLFAGKRVSVSSPQGRFELGAKLVDDTKLIRASAVGKQLFLKFAGGRTIRIHLGIFGKWQFREFEVARGSQDALPVVGEVRARFSTEYAVVDLRGPTICEVLTQAEVSTVLKRLGPDPINGDPTGLESQRFLEKVIKSRTTIGQLLMNQAVVSGIGNVYRAELLFRAQVDPYTPGNKLTEEQILEIWHDAVKLLKVGVKTGFMITRDDLAKKRPTKAERNFVYKREGKACRVCYHEISIAIMATRKLYWCAKCQS